MKELVDLNSGQRIDIDLYYGFITTIISITIVFSSAMPILIHISLLYLSMIYVLTKYNYIKYSQKPKSYNDSIDIFVTEFLLIVLLMAHLAVSLWVYTGKDIFGRDFNSNRGIGEITWLHDQIGGYSEVIDEWVDRCQRHVYIAGFLLFVIVFVIFDWILIPLINICRVKGFSEENGKNEIVMDHGKKCDYRKANFFD